MSVEIWRDVVGFEGLYQVSNRGRVKSLPKLSLAHKGKSLSPEHRRKIGVGLRRYYDNADNRIKASNATRRWWETRNAKQR